MKLFLSLFLLLFVFQVDVYAAQGVEMEIETIEEGEKDTVRMFVLDNNLKVEVKQSDSKDKTKDFVTFDGKKMCTIDNKNKECSCMTKQDITELAKEIDKQMAGIDIEAMLKDVPPEYREQARQMMKEKMPKQAVNTPVSKPDLKKVGSEFYNNYPSTKYLLTNSPEEKMDLWSTNWNKVKGGKEVANAFINMGKFFDEMLEATSKFSQGIQDDNNDFIRIWDDVDGFIHSTKSYRNGKLESETKLTKSFKRTMSLSEFSSPYACKSPLEQMKQ